MRIELVSLFPEVVQHFAALGVTGRAATQGQVTIGAHNPRAFCTDAHRTVDDRPYGGGPGMVMMAGPLEAAVNAARDSAPEGAPVVLMSPQGRRFDQALAAEAAALPGLILVAARYDGVDERFVEAHVDQEWSIGDYVVSGGELPALVAIDAIVRLLPGVLGDPESAEQDSFSDGLLDYPHYTRPETVDGVAVPPVLRSGDHAAIARWRRKQALGRTWLRRPDLLRQRGLSDDEAKLLEEFCAEQARDNEHDP